MHCHVLFLNMGPYGGRIPLWIHTCQCLTSCNNEGSLFLRCLENVDMVQKRYSCSASARIVHNKKRYSRSASTRIVQTCEARVLVCSNVCVISSFNKHGSKLCRHTRMHVHTLGYENIPVALRKKFSLMYMLSVSE